MRATKKKYKNILAGTGVRKDKGTIVGISLSRA